MKEIEIIRLFKEIMNMFLIFSYYKPNGIRSDERNDWFGDEVTKIIKIINPKCVVKFEQFVPNLYGDKKVDIIIDDLIVVSLTFPCQSVNKNWKNSIEHVGGEPLITLISNENNIKKSIGIIILPTFTYNKLSKSKTQKDEEKGTVLEKENFKYTKQDVLKYYLSRKYDKGTFNDKPDKFIFKNDPFYNMNLELLSNETYVIFYKPNYNFLDIIKNNNASEGTNYIEKIINQDDLITLFYKLSNQKKPTSI